MKISREERLEIVLAAFEKIGNEGTLHDLYNAVRETDKFKKHDFADWQSWVRMTIYRHSSDADKVFKGDPGGELDIFYLVHEKGNGEWGVRNPKK